MNGPWEFDAGGSGKFKKKKRFQAPFKQNLCRDRQLGVNPKKATKNPTEECTDSFGKTIPISDEVKYLGITLKKTC